MSLFFGRGNGGKEARETKSAGYQDLELQSAEDVTILLEYFDLLQNEFGFEMVDSYHADWEQENPFGSYLMDGYWSVAFVATRMDAGRELESVFTDHVPCDLTMYGDDGEINLS